MTNERLTLEDALLQLQKFSSQLNPNVSGISVEHIMGFRSGHLAARREIFEEIERLIKKF